MKGLNFDFTQIINFVYNHIYIIIIIFSILLVIVFCYNFPRYTHYKQLPENEFWMKGIVTQVGDGDGFSISHQPLFRSASSGNGCSLKVRMVAIDAPEVRCYNKPEQPFAKEAKEHLQALILNKLVTMNVYKLDLYNRMLWMVYVKNGWFGSINVNLEMIKSGLACVYESSYTTFGGMEDVFRKEEALAKINKRGMWINSNTILPIDYKKMYRNK